MKNWPGKRVFVGAVILGVILSVGVIVIWRLGSNANADAKQEILIRPVKTMYVTESGLSETRSFPALVNVASETKLAFRVGGPLIDFDVRIGQRLAKGDVIARIDPRDFEINVLRLTAALEEALANLKAMRAGARAEDIARLEADLSAAKAQFAEAEKNLHRFKKLVDQQAAARKDYDHAQADYHTASARMEAAAQALKIGRRGAREEDIEAAEARIKSLEADLKAAQHALEDTRLKAPFNGYVNSKFVENFEHVDAGDPIVSLLDFSDVEARTTIPEDLIIRRSDFASVSCVLDAYSGRPVTATVKEIGRKTDTANQSYPLTVSLHLPEDLDVQPGMAATLNIVLKKSEQSTAGFALPSSAVFADTDGISCVWKIDPQTMRVSKMPVNTGVFTDGAVRILSGLKDGDRIVTAGARFLRDGQKVRILDGGREKRP